MGGLGLELVDSWETYGSSWVVHNILSGLCFLTQLEDFGRLFKVRVLFGVEEVIFIPTFWTMAG